MFRSNQSSCAPVSPVSAKKAKANRRNARQSTGPKTAAGKERASRNALTHGLFSQQIVLPGENQQLFDLLREELIREHRPQTVTELFFVERMAQSMWRLNRLRACEVSCHEAHTENANRLLSHREAALLTTPGNMADMLGSAPGDSSTLEKLHRYEKRIEGTLHRSLKELRRLRTTVKGEEIPEEPSPFLRDAEMQVDEEPTVAEEEEILQNEPTAEGTCEESSPVTRASSPCQRQDEPKDQDSVIVPNRQHGLEANTVRHFSIAIFTQS